MNNNRYIQIKALNGKTISSPLVMVETNVNTNNIKLSNLFKSHIF